MRQTLNIRIQKKMLQAIHTYVYINMYINIYVYINMYISMYQIVMKSKFHSYINIK